MKHKTFLGTIFPFLSLIVILPLLILYFISMRTVTEFANSQTKNSLNESAFIIRNIMPVDRIRDMDFMTKFCKKTVRNTDMRVTIMLPDGLVTGDSHKSPLLLENHLFRDEMQEAMTGKAGYSKRYSNSLHINMYYFALPVVTEESIIGVIRVALPLRISKTIVNNIHLLIFIITILLGSGLILISFYITRKISQPIIGLANITEGISSLDFTNLKTIEGPSEIYNLSMNLQKMSKILESKFNSNIRQRKEIMAVFSALVEAIIVCDEFLNIKDINRAALNLFKVSNISDPENSLISLTRNSELNEMAERTLTEKDSQHKTILLKEHINIPSDKFENQKFTSRDLFLQVNTTLIETEGHNTRIIIVLHDITQLKTLERIRKDFVANVSHELKTPVTSIIGFAETLLDGAINNKKDSLEFLNIIHSQAYRLDLIIKDLLSLSALESYENTDIELEEYKLSKIIFTAVEACQTGIASKSTDIEVLCPPDLRLRVNSRLMEQALINLISNAVKYCPEKSLVRITGEEFSDYTLIRVSDNGPGIPNIEIPRVFERFYTIDKARSRELGGTGLGLAIVKHIVLAHKGEISLKNPNKKGTEFIIRIPN